MLRIEVIDRIHYSADSWESVRDAILGLSADLGARIQFVHLIVWYIEAVKISSFLEEDVHLMQWGVLLCPLELALFFPN